MGSKRKPSRVESVVETALRETGGVTVTGGSGLPTVVRGAPMLPMPDVQTAVGPEAIDEVLAANPPPGPPGLLERHPLAERREPVADAAPPMDGAAIGQPEAGLTLPSPAGPERDRYIVWKIRPPWMDRVDRMAQLAGLEAPAFLESLLRRAWVSMPLRDRKEGS